MKIRNGFAVTRPVGRTNRVMVDLCSEWGRPMPRTPIIIHVSTGDPYALLRERCGDTRFFADAIDAAMPSVRKQIAKQLRDSIK